MMLGLNEHYLALILGEELKTPPPTLSGLFDQANSFVKGRTPLNKKTLSSFFGKIDNFLTGGQRVLVPKMPPSAPIAAIVIPTADEMNDISGAADPSGQLSYSPENDDLHGTMLHKYHEIVLGYGSSACSGHCRFCYRSDYLSSESTDKKLGDPDKIAQHIINWNNDIKENGDVDEEGKKRYPVKEFLFSGGDSLVTSNPRTADWMRAMGKAGVESFRFGTKELAFRPERFDEAFIQTLKMVQEEYPNMDVKFIVQFNHPDEFLLRDEQGNYIKNEDGSGYQWMPESERALNALRSLPFVGILNQSPVITRVNDTVESLHILHSELNRKGITPKYMFQGRDIEGHIAFSLPIEKTWHLHNEAMKGLSDNAKSRLVMSHKRGKMEIVNVDDYTVTFKLHRAPGDASELSDVVRTLRNPDALWFDGYEDRIVQDGRHYNKEMMRILNIAIKTSASLDDVEEIVQNSNDIETVWVERFEHQDVNLDDFKELPDILDYKEETLWSVEFEPEEMTALNPKDVPEIS